MAFRCPYCEFRVAVKSPPKPGKYTPKCPKCGGKIALTVPPDLDAEWSTAAIPGEKPNIPAAPETTQPTVAASPSAPSAGSAKPAPAKPVPAKPSTPAKSPAKAPAADMDVTVAPPSARPSPAAADMDRTLAQPDDSEEDRTEVDTEVTGNFGRAPMDDDEESTQVIEGSNGSAGSSGAGVGDQTAMYQEGATQVPTGNDETLATVATPEAEPKPKKKGAKAKAAEEPPMPEVLGGYEVVKELGRGGMGAVFLARQVSLDRSVALKVMNRRWAEDPVFLARFTREAYAAAQLVHHNVVQIYDIGEQEGINFFSMEFVEGKSLGDLLKKSGKMTVESAIGYTLQAARGLKFAHDRGMIHRDIKPDNLMLNVHGIVKVADLGLVKTATMTAEDDALPNTESDLSTSRKSMTGLRSLPSDITMADTAMGSPSYMSPEQCRSAADVDPRADIYSLGCTLYALIAGQPPFTGSTVFELMTKHATDLAPPLTGVPKGVTNLVAKMLAKDPLDRQQTMDELIQELEGCLPSKAGTSMEEHLTMLETCVQRFHNSSAARLRKKLVPALLVASLVAIVVAFVMNSLAGVSLLAAPFAGIIGYFVISGMFGGTYVFRKFREWLFGARLTDWAIGILGIILFLVVLFVINPMLLVGVAASAAGAVGVAAGVYFLFDKRAAAQRQASLDDTEKMLKRLRVTGMEEDELRLFVAKNAGRNWEEFFESLFGYEAKIAARPAVQALAGDKKLPTHAGWRDGLIVRFDRILQERREAKARKHLKSVEVKRLQAEGIDKKAAEREAEEAAEHLVEQAAEIKKAKGKAVNVRKMMAIDRNAKRPPKKRKNPAKVFLGLLSGWKLRFMASAILLLLGAMWVKGQVRVDQITQNEDAAKRMLGGLFQRGNPVKWGPIADYTKWVDSINVFVAGLIMLGSIFCSRFFGVVLYMLAAAVAVAGHLFDVIPELGPLSPHHVTLAVAALLTLVGVLISGRHN